MNDVTRLFGQRAAAYASFRPHYPPALFDWLASQVKAHERALDIACGNGQASRPLLPLFEQVLACDSSPAQLAQTDGLPGLQLFAAEAQALPLPAASLDLITVAQALHWFATPGFFAEVRRTLKPGGLFCAWCYSLLRIDPPLDALLDELHGDLLAGYWPAGRASVDAGYADIHCDFPRLTPPAFAIELEWQFAQLLGYLRTWSAVQQWERQHGRDPLEEFLPRLQAAWGDLHQQRVVRWPLHFVAGFPHA